MCSRKKIGRNNNVEKVSEAAMEVQVTEDTVEYIPQNNMEDNLVDDTNDVPRNFTARDPVLYSTLAQDKLREELSEKGKNLNGSGFC